MKVTQLWYYPIKGIRGIQVDSAKLGPRGLQYDRRFMICRVKDKESGELSGLQLAKHPQCGLFAQEVVGNTIRVRYLIPREPLVPWRAEQETTLDVPLEPELDGLARANINILQSCVVAYRMGPHFDAWFSACFGFEAVLVFIGDGRRPVLGTFSPKAGNKVSGAEEDWLTFTDCAPYLFATEKSLENVNARLPGMNIEMRAMRPNIVLDGKAEWDEDFWAQLSINGKHTISITKNCNRCTSLNADYDTGRTAEGDRGKLLGKLMSYRRVDIGAKYSPIFGRYGFLISESSGDDAIVSISDDVQVTERRTERAVWDWPWQDPKAARYYQRTSGAKSLPIIFWHWLTIVALLGLVPCWFLLV